jgi:uncharacterized protein YcfL
MNRTNRGLMVAVLAAAASVAMLGGCAGDPVKPPLGARQDALPTQDYPKVNIVDDNFELQNYLVVDKGAIVTVMPGDGKPLSVSVPVRSTADNRMRLQYQFYWRDSNGVTIGQSGWRRYEVEPRTQFQAKGNAISPDATDWRLEIRSAR